MKISGLSLSRVINVSIGLMFVLLALSLHSLAAHIEDHIQKDSSQQQNQSSAKTKKTDDEKNIVKEEDLGWKKNIDLNTKEEDHKRLENESNKFVATSETKLKDIINEQKNTKREGSRSLYDQQKDIEQERASLNSQLEEFNKRTNALSSYQNVQKKNSEQEINRLARVYEQMPPRDAAAVFNVLDIRVLVPVAQHMSPRKVSAVIGGMQPDRANILTQYLIGTRKLSSQGQ